MADTRYPFTFPVKPRFLGDMDRWDRQRGYLSEYLDYVSNFRLAIDGGAYVGTWAQDLAKRFESVIAFEPIPANYRCLRLNTSEHSNIQINPRALSNHNGAITLGLKGPSFGVRFGGMNPQSYACTYIDALGVEPGFIKLDVEGEEVSALEGAEKTIRRCEPVLCVEHKHERPQIEAWMRDHGYRKVVFHRPDALWIRRTK